jgi:hypothetical protein
MLTIFGFQNIALAMMKDRMLDLGGIDCRSVSAYALASSDYELGLFFLSSTSTSLERLHFPA